MMFHFQVLKKSSWAMICVFLCFLNCLVLDVNGTKLRSNLSVPFKNKYKKGIDSNYDHKNEAINFGLKQMEDLIHINLLNKDRENDLRNNRQNFISRKHKILEGLFGQQLIHYSNNTLGHPPIRDMFIVGDGSGSKSGPEKEAESNLKRLETDASSDAIIRLEEIVRGIVEGYKNQSKECAERKNKEKCVPTCPTGCTNGYCSMYKCICPAGYQMSGPSCARRCLNQCHNGKCMKRICHCRPGYVNDGTNTCVPICTDKCPSDCRGIRVCV
uniref:EGF-like domain-containing protein n=1 Tax=Timema poppense TaxID=170557 RepID=A0A7R9DAS9_TIMPO|nr:unnamed protein product [Timema poppensis]